jgi:hypothetical protein
LRSAHIDRKLAGLLIGRLLTDDALPSAEEKCPDDACLPEEADVMAELR